MPRSALLTLALLLAALAAAAADNGTTTDPTKSIMPAPITRPASGRGLSALNKELEDIQGSLEGLADCFSTQGKALAAAKTAGQEELRKIRQQSADAAAPKAAAGLQPPHPTVDTPAAQLANTTQSCRARWTPETALTTLRSSTAPNVGLTGLMEQYQRCELVATGSTGACGAFGRLPAHDEKGMTAERACRQIGGYYRLGKALQDKAGVAAACRDLAAVDDELKQAADTGAFCAALAAGQGTGACSAFRSRKDECVRTVKMWLGDAAVCASSTPDDKKFCSVFADYRKAKAGGGAAACGGGALCLGMLQGKAGCEAAKIAARDAWCPAGNAPPVKGSAEAAAQIKKDEAARKAAEAAAAAIAAQTAKNPTPRQNAAEIAAETALREKLKALENQCTDRANVLRARIDRELTEVDHMEPRTAAADELRGRVLAVQSKFNALMKVTPEPKKGKKAPAAKTGGAATE